MAQAPSRSQSLQAPTGGWDTQAALADMPADHAVIMDNWFPDTDQVIMRRGHEEYATVSVDFGLITAAATVMEDLGLITAAADEVIDLGSVA